jgi:Helitron helicase-like domain at N-terminus
MTANLEWPEIKAALLHKDQIAPNHPNLIVRVFHAKLKSLIEDIKYDALDDWAAHLYTIEFQKRGLPHAYIILFLKPHAELCTSEDIDRLMSSEFPTEDNELLKLIQKLMVHTPCEEENPTAPLHAKWFLF